ncbi:MAG: circularly permuted type 2 ATP-grasp protein [Hyphomicrobium sp.]|uniref:circularly permuted type 2 ATP-grasp protein n=1 Tax=Hyphomicrobium sp. TaxID=82 RepID=UPI0013270A8F|nr:circularly permuted type 2 ATP-grasp protein [Hyphomicrobium sp.]KAB2943211.1 MAG: circularly permuted type 2 ATP-grasp protein [Hyphomicrobium sp.]MBZ0210148.1 circularly permuted type 2 ATP-grasp protein [Hyphomicrobium sp.]
MTLEARLPTPLDQTLLADYARACGGAHDELIDASGEVRPHWQTFLAALAALPVAEQAQRSERLNRRVREMGIAHDIFADPASPGKRWEVDLVPLIFSSTEWQALEKAIIQRARLLNAILADAYGEQRLLREGLIPPALIFSDLAFLTPCHGINPAAGYLQFYALDLAREADGNWRVIDNHTETPAGVGYALANRVVHTHIAGDLFEACNSLRLAPFFQRLQGGLTMLTGRRDPRIALLTPGPHHDDYFSHAYLARYLGYLLVEGGDLRTAGDRMFLKTLEGLKRIDLIVRCVDGRQSDPLELDAARYGGPPGLVQACRKAPELVRNALGSAVAQNRGLGAYLPAICRRLFGEELLIADAPRRWLGEEENRRHVIDNLERMVIHPAQEGTGRPGGAQYGQLGSSLTEAQRRALKEEIELHGDVLVAEERIGFGTTPAFTPQGLVPQPFAVRLFAAATSDGFTVMPGGLAMAIVPNLAVALSAPEARTRDVWIIADGEVPPHRSLWQPTIDTARVQRSQRVIQSRVADDLFWLGRYGERADWIMRVLRSALQPLRGDNAPSQVQGAARACLEALAARDGMHSLPPRDGDDAAAVERMVHLLIAAKDGRRTLDGTLDKLYRVANLTRDRLSLEAWRVLSQFRPGAEWRRALLTASPEVLLDLIEDGLGWLAAFNGLMHENMTRNQGWSFLDMGRRVERAGNMSEAILWLFGQPLDPEEETGRLFFLLEVADSFITYRSRYRLDPMLALVLDLLLLDETNPRSLAYQLASISHHLAGMPQSKQGASLTDERRLILSMLTSIRLADVEAFAKDPSRAELQEAVRNQLRLLPQLTTAIERHYFNLLEEQPHRVHTRS